MFLLPSMDCAPAHLCCRLRCASSPPASKGDFPRPAEKLWVTSRGGVNGAAGKLWAASSISVASRGGFGRRAKVDQTHTKRSKRWAKLTSTCLHSTCLHGQGLCIVPGSISQPFKYESHMMLRNNASSSDSPPQVRACPLCRAASPGSRAPGWAGPSTAANKRKGLGMWL